MATHGAFAAIDILGFKQALRRMPGDDKASELANRMLALQAATKFRAAEKKLHLENAEFAFFSDTIIVSCRPKNESEESLVQAVHDLSFLLVSVYSTALLQYDMPMRGYITVGDYLHVDTVIVGSAVFETAENYESSKEAIIWLGKPACDLMDRYFRAEGLDLPMRTARTMREKHLPKVKVTLKTGKVRTRVLNPLSYQFSEKRDEFIDHLLFLLDDHSNIDIWQKRCSTQALFQHLLQTTSPFEHP
jgi:hypothetical protein